MLKIAEIIISGTKSGESDDSSYKIKIGNRPTIIASGTPDSHRLNRISAYLNNLMAATEQKHYAAVQENNKLNDHSELITRVTLDEFSLYTKDSPLNLDEYKYLISLIAQRAKTLPPNIHLQIGTLPVFWPNGVVQNCGLYIQSPIQPGQKPLLHHLSKVHASHVDIQYGYRDTSGTIHTYPLAGDNPGLDNLTAPGGMYSPEILLKDTSVSVQDFNQYKNALRIISASGQQFLQVIDICLDHFHGVARSHIHGLICRLGAVKQFIPIHASHIISSKTINAYEHHLLATVVHADVAKTKVGSLSPSAGEAKQSINFAVGGFGQSSHYTTYPFKNIGILSGNDLEHVIWENASNGMPFKVNDIYDGTTILHLVITKSNASLQKTLNRIDTLRKYNLSVDIPDAQNQTVRSLVINHLINALIANNSQDTEKFALIANMLQLYTPDVLQQLQNMHHNHFIGSNALIALKNAVPQILIPPTVAPIINNPANRTPVINTGHNPGGNPSLIGAAGGTTREDGTPDKTPVVALVKNTHPDEAIAEKTKSIRLPKEPRTVQGPVEKKLLHEISKAELNFNKQLELLNEKREDLATRMHEADKNNDIAYSTTLKKAIDAVDDLHKGLTQAGKDYFKDPSPQNYIFFKITCDGLIGTARKELDKHRGWSAFLANLAIGITTLGLGLLIKGVINYANNKSFFFTHQTKSSKIVDNVDDNIEEMNPNNAAPSA